MKTSYVESWENNLKYAERYKYVMSAEEAMGLRILIESLEKQLEMGLIADDNGYYYMLLLYLRDQLKNEWNIPEFERAVGDVR